MFFKKNKKNEEKNKTYPKLSNTLDKNIDEIKQIFSYPENSDFKFRELYIKSIKRRGIIFYIDGIIDMQNFEESVIAPLTSNVDKEVGEIGEFLKEHILTAATIDFTNKNEQIAEDLLSGHIVLLIEDYDRALSFDVAFFESRSIDKPTNENVFKGPKEAFVESISKNKSLIRKHLKDEHLISETISIGERMKNNVVMMFINNIASDDLVKSVRKRIKEIESESIGQLSILEQHIEERPYSLIPSTLLTERPDRVGAFLREGHIILLMENSPYALIVPITFWSLFHTAEDSYQRMPYGNFIRLVRIVAFFIALMTPSLYIASTNFHIEMLPTDLMLAIAATREKVPFPSIVEVLLMEATFELLREAGIRIPTTIGPTIGIVGALILGQAAVDANIISPIMVIIVAITGLASFAIPDVSLSFAIRIARFPLLVAASVMGFFGLAGSLIMFIAYLTSYKSFDVPFLSPMAPHYSSSKDMLMRPPVWKQWLRPTNLYPKDKARKNKPEGSSNQ